MTVWITPEELTAAILRVVAAARRMLSIALVLEGERILTTAWVRVGVRTALNPLALQARPS